MFRRLNHTLPQDPIAPTDLEQLGYFVDEDDKIRMIKNSKQKYQYLVNRNERVNEIYSEAMNICVRRIVYERLKLLGLETVRLPLGVAANEKHVPILVSKNLSSKKRVIVVFGERNQELGFFSLHAIGGEGIRAASMIDFVSTLLKKQGSQSDESIPGLIISNPGQLLWYRGGSRAVGHEEWRKLPRLSAVSEQYKIDATKNTIQQNRDFKEHVEYIFNLVIPTLTRSEATINIIGLEYTGAAALDYLACRWNSWCRRIEAICLGGPQHKIHDIKSQSVHADVFLDFLSKRSRAYFVSPLPIETPIKGRDEFGCNCYSGGELSYQENLVLRCWKKMIEWFELVDTTPDFEEDEVIVHEQDMGFDE